MTQLPQIVASSSALLAILLSGPAMAQSLADVNNGNAPSAEALVQPAAAAPETAPARQMMRATISVGHDTVSGAPRYADRSVDGNGAATVRFSTVRVGPRMAGAAMPTGLPVSNARTSSGYGLRLHPVSGRQAFHHGVDLAVGSGTPVMATAQGRVVKAGWAGGYGLLVVLDNGNGVHTRFGHLSSISVREGEDVQQGQLVGRSGATGRVTGPHLHYEVRIDGGSVDPLAIAR